MEQVHQLLANRWVKLCKVPWCSLIVLAAKSRQEHVTDINDFIWRICVSYQKFNEVTKPFQYLIPRCNNAVTVLNVGEHCIWIITPDARQEYHQIALRISDQENWHFFHMTIMNTVSMLFLLEPSMRLHSTHP